RRQCRQLDLDSRAEPEEQPVRLRRTRDRRDGRRRAGARSQQRGQLRKRQRHAPPRGARHGHRHHAHRSAMAERAGTATHRRAGQPRVDHRGTMSARPYRRPASAIAAALLMAIGLAAGTAPAPQTPTAVVIEQAYRSNNIGVARLERFEFDAATAAFREALTLHPTLALARLNLGIALFYGGQPDLARTEIAAARASLDTPHADYLLGLID